MAVGVEDLGGIVDAGMKLGCNHPIGPLALADMIGLDTIKHVADSMYDVLLDTDAFYRKILFAPAFQHEMGTAEFHYLAGGYVAGRMARFPGY